MPDFRDKVALVTGAASGIGRATADLLETQGAQVWRADIPIEDARFAVRLDVTSHDDWRAAADHIVARAGGLDILVNAAGISSTGNPAGLTEVAIEDWRRVFAINVEGTLLGCQHALRAMGKRGGAIVNISSTTAACPTATLAAYGASKAAVLQLTKSVAAQCSLLGLPIRCNAVMPGMTETPMIAAMPDGPRAQWQGQIPMGRFANTGEVAAAIAFLASDAASYIDGVGLPVDGGLLSRPVIR